MRGKGNEMARREGKKEVAIFGVCEVMIDVWIEEFNETEVSNYGF